VHELLFTFRPPKLSHASRKTSWEHPELKKKYKVPPYLPYGWQRYKDQKGNLVFVE
jgi:hypothetical protein